MIEQYGPDGTRSKVYWEDNFLDTTAEYWRDEVEQYKQYDDVDAMDISAPEDMQDQQENDEQVEDDDQDFIDDDYFSTPDEDDLPSEEQFQAIQARLAEEIKKNSK